MKAKTIDTPDSGSGAEKGVCAKRFRDSQPFMGK